jgi:asparagine synthase (glutamine-hydrolysing)
MCGFISIVNVNLKNKFINDNIKNLVKINTHRGPDEIRLLKKNNYLILFRRLKIIDLSNRASQPFTIENEKITMVFNGEIYNYLELRNELKSLGFKFKSNSDTEVLIKSYIKWNLKFVEKIRGMFSIIIFDDIKKKILFFRDHIGQKPLYYTKYHDGFLLSSEIKDILFLKKNPEENNSTVLKYLLRGWCDDNHFTFFKDIYALPAGSYGVINNKKLIIKKYWKLDFSKNYPYSAEKFSNNFRNNLNLHLRSDVPIAFTLSGGLDSSSLLKTALDLKIDNYKAFSIKSSFEDEDDESKYIDKFVSLNQVKHKYLKVHNKYNKNILEELLISHDEPINSVSCINQFLLRKEIHREGYKVLIVGEGGDEVLGGYERMFLPYLYSIYLKNNKQIPKIVKENISSKLGKKFPYFLKYLENYIKNINKNKNDIEDFNVFDFLNIKENEMPKKLRYYNDAKLGQENYFKSFLASHLLKRDLPHTLRMEDRNSMSQSIENRSPFVDSKFIEYVFSLDEYFFIKNGLSKFMLRDIMQKRLPKSYLEKKKVGRPGNAKTLIFNLYFEKFCDYLSTSKYKNSYFDLKIVLKNIIKEKKENNFRRDNRFYFRVLNYLIWKQNNEKYLF